jgi:hypothetical protein
MSSHSLRNSYLLLRRVIASVVLLCVGVLTFEQFSIDVCNETTAHDVEIAAHSAEIDNHIKKENSGTRGESQQSKQSISHPGMHVCHCLHNHFGTLPMRQMIAGFISQNGSAFDEPSTLPPSITLEPPFRPPVHA